jgi:translocator protein
MIATTSFATTTVHESPTAEQKVLYEIGNDRNRIHRNAVRSVVMRTKRTRTVRTTSKPSTSTSFYCSAAKAGANDHGGYSGRITFVGQRSGSAAFSMRTQTQTKSVKTRNKIDFRKIVSVYFAAIFFEVLAIAAVLFAIDSVNLFAFLSNGNETVEVCAQFTFFMFLALRSRVFSVLDARRPKTADERKMKEEKKRPRWTPPAKVFPIVWISIAFLRAISSVLVVGAAAATATTAQQIGAGKLLTPAILSLIVHLSIGDCWNYITNQEKLLGVSCTGVFFVLISSWFAIYQYYLVLPKAGFVLMPLGVWLSIATALVIGIWNINLPRQSLWPQQK